MTKTWDNLTAISLNPEGHAKTCNYWYLVQQSYGPHTAFTTRRGLDNWLAERGLSLESELPRHAEHGHARIVGAYKTQSHMSYDEFYGLPAIGEVRELSNGDYTLGLVTQDGDGILTVHYLNPNCHYRRVFPYQESRELCK